MPRDGVRDSAPPPDGLDEVARVLWRRIRDDLRARSLWRDTDAGVLERYVRSESRARQAYAQITSHDGSLELTTVGSQGQLVEHPAIKIARAAELDCQKYAEALLLTPAARQRHQLESEVAARTGLDAGLD